MTCKGKTEARSETNAQKQIKCQIQDKNKEI